MQVCNKFMIQNAFFRIGLLMQQQKQVNPWQIKSYIINRSYRYKDQVDFQQQSLNTLLITQKMNEQQQPDYRQQIGLKKILYKYENQNQQLRSQIKALNQRLQWIVNKPKTPQQKPKLNPIQEYQGQMLKEEMGKLYKQISFESEDMKINKDAIDERHEQKCKELDNKIMKEEKEIKELTHKLQKYEQIDQGIKLKMLAKSIQTPPMTKPSSMTSPQSPNLSFQQLLLQSNNKTLRSSTIRSQTYLQKINSIKQQTQAVRKSIKQMQHMRDTNERNLIKKHQYQNDFKEYNKVLQTGGQQQIVGEENSPKKKGVWGMENTKENYEFVKSELEKLKKQKNSVLDCIRNQNIVLEKKIIQLQNQLQGLDKSIQIPPLPYQKRPLKVPVDLSVSTKIQSPLLQKKLLQPLQPTVQQFQRKNDKNFVPKTSRKVEWQSTKNTNGIEWYDSKFKSPIVGINLWMDGFLVGIQMLHEMGSSGQQLQVLGGKKIVPIQYRLGDNDYLENVVIYISEGLVHGIQLVSKNGRLDKFGNISKARKFDFAIKKPQKPVVSFGQYRIHNNISQVTKLGFEVI